MLRKILYICFIIGLLSLHGHDMAIAADALPGIEPDASTTPATPAVQPTEPDSIKPVEIIAPNDTINQSADPKKTDAENDAISPATIEAEELPQKEKKSSPDMQTGKAKKKDISEEENIDKPLEFKYESFDKDQLACPATPYVETSNRNLKSTKRGNNLRQKQGSPLIAGGSYTLIRGRVVDENCLPIQGAAVEIWQADKLGNYEWEYDVTNRWQEPLAGKDENFMFSGMAQTDNLGRFNFFTIMPGAKNTGAPHINVIVKRSGYNNLHTRVYFRNNTSNSTDPTLLLISEEDKKMIVANGRNLDPQNPYAGAEYYYTIILRGVSPYKRY